MSGIEKVTGRAGEYCGLKVEPYTGCSHDCGYCYARRFQRKTRELWKIVKPKADIVNVVARQARKYRDQEVEFCFGSDPYNALDVELMLTRSILEVFKQERVIPRILTKAGLKSTRDFDLLDDRSWYGSTLTLLDPVASMREEPGAALPEDRFAALREAKARGLRTWASLEPVLDPAQTIEIIERSHAFIDHYKIGVLNYDRRAKAIDWALFLSDVTAVLQRYGCSHYIKDDLRKYEGGFHLYEGTEDLDLPTVQGV